MKKIPFSLALLCLLHAGTASGQAAKSAYAEIGGPGLASLNYDMRFTKSEKGIGGRAGIGGFTVRSTYFDGYDSYSDKTSILFIPLEINYLLGRDEKNYFEAGAGYTLVSAKNRDSGFDYEDENFNTSFGHLYFGYRRQPKEGGFLFRAGICPVFGNGFFVPYYAGVSFGYKF